MDKLHQQSREMLDRLAEVSDFLGVCARSLVTKSPVSNATGAESVRVITDPAEVSRLSSEIPTMAQSSYCSVQTGGKLHRAHLMIGPVTRLSADEAVHSRVIVGNSFAQDHQARAIMLAGASRGEEIRCHAAPPLKFMVVDSALAMLPLDESGTAGAVVLRSAAIGALLSWAFEHLWDESEPFSRAQPRSADLDPVHVRILRLLADDSTDLAMADSLGVSDRSVRRHISILLDRLGVHSRHGAVAAAFRQGLLP